VGVAGLSSREAVSWRNESAKHSIRLVFDLVGKRMDDLLQDTSVKNKILQDLHDLRETAEQEIEQHGSR